MSSGIISVIVTSIMIALGWNVMNLNKPFHYRIGGAIVLCVFASILLGANL